MQAVTPQAATRPVIDDIWRVPAYLPYVHSALSPEDITHAQSRLGIALPPEYVALLSKQNGGYVRRKLPDSVHSMIWGIGSTFPSITRIHEWQEDGSPEEGTWAPSNAKLLFPFDGDGHWYLCFDYRLGGRQSAPGVSFVDLELGRETRIADTFCAFIDLLKPDYAPTQRGIIGSWSLESAATALQASLGVTFESQGHLNNGYEVRRAKLGDGQRPEWVWLSPNEVPRGFIRPNDKRYNELNGTLPGNGLRFPEHPSVCLELSTTDGVATLVQEACRRSAIHTIRFDGGE